MVLIVLPNCTKAVQACTKVVMTCTEAMLTDTEVIQNGKKVNSQTLKLPSGKKLKGNEREQFELAKIKIDVLKAELINETN